MKSRFEEAIDEIEKENQRPKNNHYLLALVVILIIAFLISIVFYMYNNKSAEIIISEDMPPYLPGNEGNLMEGLIPSDKIGEGIQSDSPPPLPDFPV